MCELQYAPILHSPQPLYPLPKIQIHKMGHNARLSVHQLFCRNINLQTYAQPTANKSTQRART